MTKKESAKKPPSRRKAAKDKTQKSAVEPELLEDVDAHPETGDGFLSVAGQKLAAIILDPRYEKANSIERSTAAGISNRTYWRLMSDPKFQAAIKAHAFHMIAPRLMPVVSAMIENASNPNKEGTRDRELLFKALGWLEERKKHEHTGQVEHSHGIRPPDEVESELMKLKLPPPEPTIVEGGT